MKSAKSMLVSAAVLLAAMTALSACASKSTSTKASDSGSSGGSGASAKKADLSIMWQGAQARHTATLKALDLYTKNNPNITFTPTYTDWNSFWDKLTTLAASHKMPDIMQQDAAFIQDYAQKGLLADLSGMDLKGIIDPKVLESVKINGKLYGVPISGNGQGMIYNKEMLSSAGITIPKNGWTWDDYFNFAKEARGKLPKEQYGIVDSSNDWNWYQFYQMSEGKGPVLDGVKFNLDKDLWYKFQNLYAQFRKDGVVPPADLNASFKGQDPKLDPMASGKVAMQTISVGAAASIDQLMQGKVEVLSDPTGPKGGGWAQPTIFWSIGSNTKNLAEAETVIKWLVSDPEANKILGTSRGIPINQEVWDSLKGNLSEDSITQKNLLDRATPYAMPFSPAPPGWNDWVTAYNAELQAVQFGKETLDQAYAKVTKLGQDTAAKLANQKK